MTKQNALVAVGKEEIAKQIEEGWEAARRGQFVDADEFFRSVYAELDSFENSRK